MGQAATDGAPVANLEMPDVRYGCGHHGEGIPDRIRTLQVSLPGEGTDRNRAISRGDSRQPLDPVDVDDYGRSHQPQVHHGHQALSAGQHLGIRAVLRQQLQCLFQCGWREIIELGGFHILSLILTSSHWKRKFIENP